MHGEVHAARITASATAANGNELPRHHSRQIHHRMERMLTQDCVYTHTIQREESCTYRSGVLDDILLDEACFLWLHNGNPRQSLASWRCHACRNHRLSLHLCSSAFIQGVVVRYHTYIHIGDTHTRIHGFPFHVLLLHIDQQYDTDWYCTTPRCNLHM